MYMKTDITYGTPSVVSVNNKYCGIFAESKKCGARETAVASKRFWDNIHF
jgi:hypothetical protein